MVLYTYIYMVKLLWTIATKIEKLSKKKEREKEEKF